MSSETPSLDADLVELRVHAEGAGFEDACIPDNGGAFDPSHPARVERNRHEAVGQPLTSLSALLSEIRTTPPTPMPDDAEGLGASALARVRHLLRCIEACAGDPDVFGAIEDAASHARNALAILDGDEAAP